MNNVHRVMAHFVSKIITKNISNIYMKAFYDNNYNTFCIQKMKIIMRTINNSKCSNT